MKTYCLALDLKDDPALIQEYRRYHQPDVIWPEVMESIRAHGVLSEHIFLLGTRMVMVLQTTDNFSLEKKAAIDKENPAMQAWEELMWRFQQPVPGARTGEKWVLMEKIFEAKQ
jgi:L-rhamnose mutarotase